MFAASWRSFTLSSTTSSSTQQVCDVAQLSPFVHRDINVHGPYTFATAKRPQGLWVLCDPDTHVEDGD
jgi:hypothetical protein